MQLSRRDFLALSGVSSLLGVPTASGQEPTTPAKLRQAKETTSICPYCGVGCGLIVTPWTERSSTSRAIPTAP